jgi:hypothetical protein
MERISRDLINKYGEYNEKLKIIEELNELQEVIIRDVTHGECDRKHILEERVDVELMLHLIDEIYCFSDFTRINEWCRRKKKIEKEYL